MCGDQHVEGAEYLSGALYCAAEFSVGFGGVAVKGFGAVPVAVFSCRCHELYLGRRGMLRIAVFLGCLSPSILPNGNASRNPRLKLFFRLENCVVARLPRAELLNSYGIVEGAIMGCADARPGRGLTDPGCICRGGRRNGILRLIRQPHANASISRPRREAHTRRACMRESYA